LLAPEALAEFGRGACVMLLTPKRACALLAQAGCKVNGVEPLPLRVLRDRDEIRAGGDVIYFSTDTRAEPAAFVGAGKPVRCARCHSELQQGEQAVHCPGCGSVQHAECWSYAVTCASCKQATSGSTWTPEESAA